MQIMKIHFIILAFIFTFPFLGWLSAAPTNDKKRKLDQDAQIEKSLSPSKKAEIPDLNFPPPVEKESMKKVKKSPYNILTERKIKEGKYEDFIKGERNRFKAYRDSLTPEQKLEISRKNQKRYDERLAESEELRKRRRETVAAANRRLKARKKAEKKGLTIKPELALRTGELHPKRLKQTKSSSDSPMKYVVTLLQVAAVKDSKESKQAQSPKTYNLHVRPSQRPIKFPKKKEPIPDLNFPPPPEEDQNVTFDHKNKRKRNAHAQRIAKHIRDGTLEEFRQAERIRRREYSNKFTSNELKEISRKHENIRRARNAESKERTERTQLISRLATRRYKARLDAKQKGIQLDPKNALKNHPRLRKIPEELLGKDKSEDEK